MLKRETLASALALHFMQMREKFARNAVRKVTLKRKMSLGCCALVASSSHRLAVEKRGKRVVSRRIVDILGVLILKVAAMRLEIKLTRYGLNGARILL